MTVSLYDAFIGSLSLRQCTSAAHSPGGNPVVVRNSGGLDPALIAGGQAAPKATFATLDLYNLLNTVSVQNGFHVAAGTISIPFQQRLQGATFEGDDANQILTAANALCVITGIEASQQSDTASGNLEVVFRSTDGLTEPVTINVDQDLTAQAFQAAYKMGPVKARVGADSAVAQIAGIQSFSVNPGVPVVATSRDGGIWPTLLTINERNPSIDLTFDNFDALARFNATYTSINSLTVYLRKLSDGGTFVADATTGHISLTLTGGLATLQSVGAQANADGSVTVRFTGKTLASSVAAAISL